MTRNFQTASLRNPSQAAIPNNFFSRPVYHQSVQVQSSNDRQVIFRHETKHFKFQIKKLNFYLQYFVVRHELQVSTLRNPPQTATRAQFPARTVNHPAGRGITMTNYNQYHQGSQPGDQSVARQQVLNIPMQNPERASFVVNEQHENQALRLSFPSSVSPTSVQINVFNNTWPTQGPQRPALEQQHAFRPTVQRNLKFPTQQEHEIVHWDTVSSDFKNSGPWYRVYGVTGEKYGKLKRNAPIYDIVSGLPYKYCRRCGKQSDPCPPCYYDRGVNANRVFHKCLNTKCSDTFNVFKFWN